ncbi:hypothetical protein EV401DRAFT_65095 [Pisolithus croceorrhizus]|nr:hypothetical protein EV401DRAFT_65095 [Pisolithus croceorrhizus]
MGMKWKRISYLISCVMAMTSPMRVSLLSDARERETTRTAWRRGGILQRRISIYDRHLDSVHSMTWSQSSSSSLFLETTCAPCRV